MFYRIIPLIIGAILLGFFLYFRVKEKRLVAVIFKGLVSLMFMVTAVVSWTTALHSESKVGIFIIIGLFFGLLGDIFLDLKYMILEREMLFTSLGFCTFAIGHTFYITSLFVYYYDPSYSPLYWIIPVILSLLLTTGALLMGKFTKIRYGKMIPFVALYGLILFFSTSIYMSFAIQTAFSLWQVGLMAIGLIFFMLSDLILNNTYFAPGFNTPAFIISNHILYYIGQFMIAVSLFYLI